MSLSEPDSCFILENGTLKKDNFEGQGFRGGSGEKEGNVARTRNC